MGTPNWGMLLEHDRCKAIGVPWSNEELKAVYELKIPADYVRNGCLTLEDYNKEKSEVEALPVKPLRYMKKEELLAIAKSIQIECTPDVTRVDLIHLIQTKQAKLSVDEQKS